MVPIVCGILIEDAPLYRTFVRRGQSGGDDVGGGGGGGVGGVRASV